MVARAPLACSGACRFRGGCFLGNSLVLGIAIELLAATPVRVRVPSALEEAVVLVAGITAILLTNLVLLRRAFAPLNRLTALMRNWSPSSQAGGFRFMATTRRWSS
jgi:hypothetical protein